MTTELFELLRSSKGVVSRTSYDDGDEITSLYTDRGRWIADRIITGDGGILFPEE